jgi:hypothetical protein
MTKPWIARALLAVLVVATCTACGADEKPSADPETTPKATATSTPSATPSTPPKQPRGAYGVTYDIVNWEKYADEPAVLAWKQTTEAASGSLNGKKLIPALRQGTSPSMFKLYFRSLQDGWANGWYVRPVAKIRIQSVESGGRTSKVHVCSWDPSAVFYEKDGSAVGGVKKEWTRQIVGMTLQGARWRVSSVDTPGKCKGVPPP